MKNFKMLQSNEATKRVVEADQDYTAQVLIEELIEQLKHQCQCIINLVDQRDFPNESHGTRELLEHQANIGLIAGKILVIRDLSDSISENGLDFDEIEGVLHV